MPTETYLPHRRTELRIKRNALSIETILIRQEEKHILRRLRRNIERAKTRSNEALQATRASIYNHRVNEVRTEGRSAHLAACFLRGTDYRRVENPAFTRSLPDWERVTAIVVTFSDLDKRDVIQKLKSWFESDGWLDINAVAHKEREGTRASRTAIHRAKRAAAPTPETDTVVTA